MPKNQKAFRALNRLIDAGYDTEKKIMTMSVDEMLKLPGVTINELSYIVALQKSIKAGQVISYLAKGKEEDSHEAKGPDPVY